MYFTNVYIIILVFYRENSIITDGEVSSLCRELRQIAINVQYENETISILPSPRVSPLMFLDRPEKLNGDEDKDGETLINIIIFNEYTILKGKYHNLLRIFFQNSTVLI